MDKVGDGILPNNLEPLSNDVNCFRAKKRNGLIHKSGSNALAGGTLHCHYPADGQNMIASTSGPVLNTLLVTLPRAQGSHAG